MKINTIIIAAGPVEHFFLALFSPLIVLPARLGFIGLLLAVTVWVALPVAGWVCGEWAGLSVGCLMLYFLCASCYADLKACETTLNKEDTNDKE